MAKKKVEDFTPSETQARALQLRMGQPVPADKPTPTSKDQAHGK